MLRVIRILCLLFLISWLPLRSESTDGALAIFATEFVVEPTSRAGYAELHVYIYLRNPGPGSIRVPVGSCLSVSSWADLVPPQIAIKTRVKSLNDEVLLKPSPGQLDYIELNPEDVTELRRVVLFVPLDCKGGVKVQYYVDPGMRKFYPGGWVGTIDCIADDTTWKAKKKRN
jgi:hypothetical protein